MTVAAPPDSARAPSADAQAGGSAVPRSVLGAGWRWLVAWWPLLALAALAFVVRWPNLQYIPQFTDEVFDGQVAYGIWEGKRPLIGVNAYTGAFYYYVLAGVFWLFGPSIYAPRLLVMVLGIGAVLATGLLGADLGRRAARGAGAQDLRVSGWIGALVGGGLLATSAVHVLTNSHLAWPHCTLPLYLTLAFWLVEKALTPQPPLPVRGRGGDESLLPSL